MFVDEQSLRVAVESVRRQVYGVGSLTVIGGGDDGSRASARLGVQHAMDFASWLSDLGSESDYIWLVHGDARPRPDALGALVAEALRSDASIVGSKILMADDPRFLESIGSSTDVFGELYSGLDPHEVDLEQYDVVRDVASVSAVSVLTRRDLFMGLGGPDPLLSPRVAGQDLSQRARLAGGRVMVAPASEVLHVGRCQDDAIWRDQAGRMRAMFKAYRWPTLVWVIPIGLIIGLIDGVARLFLGTFRPLVDFVAALFWNIARLPSTFAARKRFHRVRQTGDEELFRYQVGGSARIRSLGTDIGERFGWIVDDEPGVVTRAELESESSLAGPVVAGLALLTLGIGTRVVWLSTGNAVGFWLPAHPDAGSVLSSYAGGWNPAGLGSPESLHPASAMVAAVQWLLGGWQGATPLVSGLALLSGAIGISRLLDRMGVTGSARHLAGLVYLLGPFAGRFTAEAYWPGLISLGALPWLIDSVVVRWPLGPRRRAGRVAQMTLSAGLVSAFAPVAAAVVIVAVIVAALTFSRFSRWSALGWSIVATVLGADLVAPYLLGVAPSSITAGPLGVSIWPHPIALALAGVAAVGAVAFGRDRVSRVAAWGAGMVAIALAASVIMDGGELLVALIDLASLGLAVLVGAALDVDLLRTRLSIVGQATAAAAAGVIVLATLVAVPNGRAGMPPDEWGGALTFADELVSGSAGERVLIVGDPASIPGGFRVGNGYAYRLVTGATPTLDQAWLAPQRIGDRALADTLASIDTSTDVRPGARLAQFAIRWVVVVDDAPPIRSLRSQVDLAERGFDPSIAVYENLAFRGRVIGPDAVWETGRVEANGPGGEGRVRVADNADPGWVPDWQQDDWANSLSAETGLVSFRADAVRAGLAWASLAIMLTALVVAWWGRERRT